MSPFDRNCGIGYNAVFKESVRRLRLLRVLNSGDGLCSLFYSMHSDAS